MPNFMLLLHVRTDHKWPEAPDELMAVTKSYMAWADRMRAEGLHKGGEKLAEGAGKIITIDPAGRITTTDGPYAESKEVLGGFFIISAPNYDDACRIAITSPHLGYGGRIEVREIHEL
jgi:hypothetical protein